MTEPERYKSAAAVDAAIRDTARKAAAADPSLSVGDRIRQEHFRRFLSRVFAEHDGSGWMLKGGTGMLARVASARTTTDVDLFRANRSLDAALSDLRRLAAVDLDDFFRFEYVGHQDAVGGDQQTSTEGYGVDFEIYIGVSQKGRLHVDLVVGVVVTGEATLAAPANALPLPKLPSHDYRLYPVVDQIADKVCATMAVYNGRPSSREKDLVDLVVLARSEDVDAVSLEHAIRMESQVRRLEPFSNIAIPKGWGRQYAKLAKPVPLCVEHPTVDAAAELMQAFIDPVLSGTVLEKTWDHRAQRWAH